MRTEFGIRQRLESCGVVRFSNFFFPYYFVKIMQQKQLFSLIASSLSAVHAILTYFYLQRYYTFKIWHLNVSLR